MKKVTKFDKDGFPILKKDSEWNGSWTEKGLDDCVEEVYKKTISQHFKISTEDVNKLNYNIYNKSFEVKKIINQDYYYYDVAVKKYKPEIRKPDFEKIEDNLDLDIYNKDYNEFKKVFVENMLKDLGPKNFIKFLSPALKVNDKYGSNFANQNMYHDLLMANKIIKNKYLLALYSAESNIDKFRGSFSAIRSLLSKVKSDPESFNFAKDLFMSSETMKFKKNQNFFWNEVCNGSYNVPVDLDIKKEFSNLDVTKELETFKIDCIPMNVFNFNLIDLMCFNDSIKSYLFKSITPNIVKSLKEVYPENHFMEHSVEVKEIQKTTIGIDTNFCSPDAFIKSLKQYISMENNDTIIKEENIKIKFITILEANINKENLEKAMGEVSMDEICQEDITQIFKNKI